MTPSELSEVSMSTRAIAPIIGVMQQAVSKSLCSTAGDNHVVTSRAPEPVEEPVEIYQPLSRDEDQPTECCQEIHQQLRHNPHMNRFQCDSCQTHRYLWVIGHTMVEPRVRVFRAHQGGEKFDRSTEGHMEVAYFCRRCGQRDSMRITDPEDFPDPSEVLDDDEVRSELGYIVGPGESPQS